MSQYEKESLSALLDNEADDLELRRLLKACESDPELARTWTRYNLAQAVLHGTGVPVSAGLREGVRDALASEPAHRTPAAGVHWQQHLARAALAASVAVAVIFGFQASLDDSAGSGPTLVEQRTAAPADPGAEGSTEALLAEAESIQVDPEAQQRLREYIERMTFDQAQPTPIEHIQDSPLYRLVNQLQESPRN